MNDEPRETSWLSPWEPSHSADAASDAASPGRPGPAADGRDDRAAAREGPPVAGYRPLYAAGPPRPMPTVTGALPRPSRRGALGLIVVASMLLGGLAGGAAGFVAGRQAAPASNSTAGASPVSAEVGSAVHAVTVIKDVSSQAQDVVRRVLPAVVTVVNTQDTQDAFGNQSEQVATGSGVIIDKDGHIITNNHVVTGATKLEVIFSTTGGTGGKKVVATLVGSDPDNDVAVIKVDAPVPGWVPLGDSARLQPGETVLAIGSALGDFRNTVTEGIVSALDRQITETADDGTQHTLTNIIQTDAAINHGNSGGPLVDLNGYVIGINTAIVRSSSGGSSTNPFGGLPGFGSVDTTDQAQGLGFAISSNTVKTVAQRLLIRTPRAYLGVEAPTLSPQFASYLGVPVGAIIRLVQPGSPAARAGLQVRDIIVKLGGQAVDDSHPLTRLVQAHKPGERVPLLINRAGRMLTVVVALGTRPS